MPTWAIWVVCFFFLLVRALFAAAEAALYATSDLKAKELAQMHPRLGRKVAFHKGDRENTAAALRMGVSLLGFCAVALGTLVPPRLLDFSRFGDQPIMPLLSLLAGALLMAAFATVFDVFLRALAIEWPEKWALATAYPVSGLKLLLLPMLRVVRFSLNLLLRPFGRTVRFEPPPPPLEELEKLLAAQALREKVDPDAPALIRSIFELSDKRCRDVMVPRTEVVSVDFKTTPDEVVRILAEENHSRLPVYDEDSDRIVGTLHARDLIPLLAHPELIVLPDIIRPAHYVPWAKPIGDLLREMQQKRIHMAVVVDEYGSFLGVVTLEDILREIVGDIGDEFEERKRLIEKQPDGSYLVAASLERDEFHMAFGAELPEEGGFDTLGGFLSSLAGRIPEVGERLSWNGFTFVVHSKEGPRLNRLRVVRPRTIPPQKVAHSVS